MAKELRYTVTVIDDIWNDYEMFWEYQIELIEDSEVVERHFYTTKEAKEELVLAEFLSKGEYVKERDR